MDSGLGNTLLPGDPRLLDHIVGEVKSQGIFDQFRKDALADVDTKPAYQNLRTRVEGSVNSFLAKQFWRTDLNKNQLRETLRKHISVAPYLDAGVERIVDQVVNPKIYSVFMPEIEDVVYKYLGLEKPKRENNGTGCLKDLLPIDLDPVSPESDKNSLKDLSLDSIDADINQEKRRMEIIQDSYTDVVKDETDDADDKVIDGNCENKEKSATINDSIDNDKNDHSNTTPLMDTNTSLIDSTKSDDKADEEEEDSPVFEPIDIMNLHDSNVSNDSHLSGISELTSHRSCSPDFVNELSRDNFDMNNQDSQFSKVSSNSRLSIVTDVGSSNQASTSLYDLTKEENMKKHIVKDDCQSASNDENHTDILTDANNKSKENSSDSKDYMKSFKNVNMVSKESSQDDMDNNSRNSYKDKDTNRLLSKHKSSKERFDSKEYKNRKDRDKDLKKKVDSTDSKNNKLKEIRNDKSTDSSIVKQKDDKAKEGKDLKDIYKEKIRELREKKELTEKEKLNKREKKDSRSGSSKSSSNSSVRDESKVKSSSSTREESSSSSSYKSSKSDSKDTSKRNDVKYSQNKKDKNRTDTIELKLDNNRMSRSEKDEITRQKLSSNNNDNNRKESTRPDSYSKSSEKLDSKRDTDSRDKKRRDDKKSKSKDDHSSFRKDSNDRRSSDRDGSNGSNGKGTDNNHSSPSTSSKSMAFKGESNNSTGNSNSETSDDIDESQTEKCENFSGNKSNEIISIENIDKTFTLLNDQEALKKFDFEQNEISLPLKKRPLNTDESPPEIIIKKPKFARNFQEAKKLMKLRKKLEKQKNRAQSVKNLPNHSPLLIVPDNERVQIIEFPVESDDENDSDGITQKQTLLILESESQQKSEIITKELVCKSKLSEVELSIRESLNNMLTDEHLEISNQKNSQNLESQMTDETKKNIEFKCITTSIKNNGISSEIDKRSSSSDDEQEDCRYFVVDNERLIKFNKFLQSLDIGEQNSKFTRERLDKACEIIPMAPPRSKRKNSSSPLSDILLNNSNNNNDTQKIVPVISNDELMAKKKRLGRPKKQRSNANVNSIISQTITNGEQFEMPLSPESDVSATSEKIPLQLNKDEKNRPRSNQHYTSDDLYKPRLLFVGSSRRNRRSNQT